MVVIVDSGSTKADWKVVNGQEVHSISTMGFNPVFHNSELIQSEVFKAFSKNTFPGETTHVYYYGAGCWDTRLKKVVEEALSQVFNHAAINVEHDLLGAARATCGNQAGIACILGTGSNSCLYDGRDVVDNVTNLGYLLGDEGSGTHIGKRLIRAYFYRELPKELKNAMDEHFPGGRQTILDNVYGKGTPNVYLASFTRFLHQYRHHPYFQTLLYLSFSEFIDRHVRKYHGHLGLPIHFIGSVAYYFQETLQAILEERNMTLGQVIQKPIDNLVGFHTSSN